MWKLFLLGALVTVSSGAAAPDKTTGVVLVDKKTNSLHMANYHQGEFKIVKTFHATLGKVKGDKEIEGDLKTPEGIYIFKSKTMAPVLKPKFGEMAFYLNFPNTFDLLAGRSGSNIMLHATNEPNRLLLNYDSEGCVVVKNEEIREISPHIRLGLTPILIFPEMKDEFMRPGLNVPLRSFFEGWVQAWESRDSSRYIDFYHSDFSANGKTRDGWRAYKESLIQRYSTIQVNPEDVLYYRHPKYSMITFTQNYRSRLKSGGWGHRSRGTKILYIAEEAGQPKIIAETFSNLMW